MMPITDFLNCTEPIEGFESLSYHQIAHANAYFGLIGATNKTIDNIARHVMPAGSERALSKFLGDCDWDEGQLNLERLDELQRQNETRWPKKGYIVIEDSLIEKWCEEIPEVGRFYDHADGEFIWAQNSVYTNYTDETKLERA